jgi:DNA-binding transcriptional LysR family regulator
MKATIDSRQLNAFVALARRGSFTLAARELDLSQSAVSHAIKALEQDIGSRLFDRLGKRVQLTQTGRKFLRHAEGILRDMRAARVEIEEHSRWGHDRLRVGATLTICEHIIPTALREFRESFPQCAMRIEPGDYDRQIELLRTSQVDLALMLEPAELALDDLSFVSLFEDELRFVVARHHPWARADKVSRQAIAQEQVILYNQSSYTFRLITDYFREEQVELNNAIEFGSMEAIKEMAKLGLGAGIVAPWIVERELKLGTLVSLPLGARPLRRRWGVASWKGRPLALAEEIFVGLCEAVAENLGLRDARTPQ